MPGIIDSTTIILSAVIFVLMMLDILKYKNNRKLALAITINALTLAVIYFVLIFVGAEPPGWSCFWSVLCFAVAAAWFAEARRHKKAADRDRTADKQERITR